MAGIAGNLPKQFIPLVGTRSTFQMALDMLADDLFKTPIVVSNHAYRFLIGEQLLEIGRTARIVLELTGRDSGPAVAVAVELAARIAPDTIVAVLAADHVIQNKAGFIAFCNETAVAAMRGHIVTLGIRPNHAATDYGYIKPGHSLIDDHDVFAVDRFVEKPNAATAARHVDEGYLRNSGNFFFRADVMQSELLAFEPAMIKAAASAVTRSKTDLDSTLLDPDSFAGATKKSIDYAIMEKTDKAAVVPADIGWSDVGNWASVWELSDCDAEGNSVRGHGVVMDAANVHIRSNDHLTAVVGVDNVIVVTTHGAVLVVGQEHGDKVKQLVEHLKLAKRPSTSVPIHLGATINRSTTGHATKSSGSS